MPVFVLDTHKNPLMPCSEKRARHLLAGKRAVVHRLEPFIIRLKDRRVEESRVQSVVLKLDPGSKTTGVALVREETTEAGSVHHAIHLAHLHHRGEVVHHAMQQRSSYRRRRRSAHIRYRAPKFLNRRRSPGWLPPSLRSRIGNVLTWTRRYQRWAPLVLIEVERVHIRPRSRGGSNRVSNLMLACHDCNSAKGDRTASEFGHPEIETQAKTPLRDAAAVNTTRFALVEALRVLGLDIRAWSGGRTRWNRDRFGIRKEHALDALCVGDIAGVDPGRSRILKIMAQGRGRYQRTLVTDAGFPRGYLMRQKRVKGFQTGDLVRAVVPDHLKTQGIHRGRVAVRATGSFRVGKVDGINAKYCRLLQRADGYEGILL